MYYIYTDRIKKQIELNNVLTGIFHTYQRKKDQSSGY